MELNIHMLTVNSSDEENLQEFLPHIHHIHWISNYDNTNNITKHLILILRENLTNMGFTLNVKKYQLQSNHCLLKRTQGSIMVPNALITIQEMSPLNV